MSETNQTPVIILAFANSEQNPLPRLEEEQKQLSALLANRSLDVEVLAPVTIEKTVDTFQREEFRNRIAIFHFAGHANADSVIFESQAGESQPIHSEGLKGFLSDQEGLSLVFLNGCSTREQAEAYLQAGVKAIIATDQNIIDEEASEFALRFYKGMLNNLSIQEAFEDAVDQLTAQKGSDPSKYYRNLEGIFTYIKDQGFPWILYPEKGDAIEWKFPSSSRLGDINYRQLLVPAALLLIPLLLLGLSFVVPVREARVSADIEVSELGFRLISDDDTGMIEEGMGLLSFEVHQGKIQYDLQPGTTQEKEAGEDIYRIIASIPGNATLDSLNISNGSTVKVQPITDGTRAFRLNVDGSAIDTALVIVDVKGGHKVKINGVEFEERENDKIFNLKPKEGKFILDFSIAGNSKATFEPKRAIDQLTLVDETGKPTIVSGSLDFQKQTQGNLSEQTPYILGKDGKIKGIQFQSVETILEEISLVNNTIRLKFSGTVKNMREVSVVGQRMGSLMPTYYQKIQERLNIGKLNLVTLIGGYISFLAGLLTLFNNLASVSGFFNRLFGRKANTQ